MELPGSDEMARNFVGSTETTAAVELMTESDQLRAEVRRLRLHCERLEEISRRQETHISILTRTCEQLVEELETSQEQDRGLTLLTPPSSGRSSYSSLPDSNDDHVFCSTKLTVPGPSTGTETQHHMQETVQCQRCQTLEQELAKTRNEIEALDRQLQHAAKQKYLLQEQLCNFEEDIGILVQRGLSHKQT